MQATQTRSAAPRNGADADYSVPQAAEPTGYQGAAKMLGPAEPRHYTIPEMEVIAQKAASSQMFNSGGEEGSRPLTADQAFMFGLIAEALNMPYALVLLRFEIVMGKPSMKTAYVQAEYQKQGGSIEWVETNGERVEAVFISKRHPKPFKIALTLKELSDRKIATRYDKDKRAWVLKRSYENNPRAMLRYRAITEAVRATDPGILMGMYTDVEALDFEAEDAPTEQAVAARASLVETLAKRKEGSPKETHQPVAAVASELKAHEATKAEPEKPAENFPWKKVIADAVADFNAALSGLADANPSNTALRISMRPQEVLKRVLDGAIADELVVEDALRNESGRRAAAKCEASMQSLWDDDAEDTEARIARFLGRKMTELMGPPAAPAVQQELPAA